MCQALAELGRLGQRVDNSCGQAVLLGYANRVFSSLATQVLGLPGAEVQAMLMLMPAPARVRGEAESEKGGAHTGAAVPAERDSGDAEGAEGAEGGLAVGSTAVSTYRQLQLQLEEASAQLVEQRRLREEAEASGASLVHTAAEAAEAAVVERQRLQAEAAEMQARLVASEQQSGALRTSLGCAEVRVLELEEQLATARGLQGGTQRELEGARWELGRALAHAEAAQRSAHAEHLELSRAGRAAEAERRLVEQELRGVRGEMGEQQ
jgi:hypothetical protein